MSEILFKLIPIFAFFSIGLCLRKFKVAGPADGVFLTKFIFFVTMPALVILTISKFEMSGDRWLLPLANFIVDLACLGFAVAFTKWKKIEGITAGNLIVGAALVNSVFMFPFIYAFYGDEGLAKALLFDFGNILTMATVVYGLAYSYSGQNISRVKVAFKVLFSPVVIALIVALVLTVFNLSLPKIAYSVLRPVGNMTMPALLIALGILFTVKFDHLRLAGVGIAIRMVFGILVGLAVALAFGLRGNSFEVVLLMSAAPIGFMSVTLASIAKLDVEFATTMASASVFVGLFTIPLIIAVLGTIST